MENVDKNKTLDNTNAFFDENLTSVNLNKYLEDIYKLLDDDSLTLQYQNNVKLTQLHNKNHKRYYSIDILNLNNLPSFFDEEKNEILKLYNSINGEEILEADMDNSYNISKLLDSIELRYTKLSNSIKTYIKEKTEQNDKIQKKFSRTYFNNLNIDKKEKEDLIEKYNDLVLFSSYINSNSFLEVKRQLERETKLNDILKQINKEELNNKQKTNLSNLDILNKKIDKLINLYNEKFNYLDDLILENSKYEIQYNEIKNFYNKIIAYDDKDYENTKQTYEILIDDTKLREYILKYEKLFISERENKLKEEKLIFEKVGKKNLKNTLDYISSYYLDNLDDFDKKIINYSYSCLDNKDELEKLNSVIKLIVNKIWMNSITDIYSFNSDKDYCFLCSNNRFVDPKYQAILITKKEIEKVNDYEDYQIGFICDYNDNIMYITENDDIMSVENIDDMSNLKTPIQLEKEFMDFKVCNRLSLNGYITKIVGVYFINDGDMDKYVKAVELANLYNLPLINIKK